MKYLLLPLLFLTVQSCLSQTTISGNISDKENGESMSYTTIYIEGTNVSTSSNIYGFYSLTIPESLVSDSLITISYSFVGYNSQKMKVNVMNDVKLNIELKVSSSTLTEAIVTTELTRQKEELKSTDMSATRMQMKEIRTLPSLGGETDIIKVIQLLPGVQGGTEGGTGMFVRGGDADQNLVLLDEATVYNIGHLFGFFSVFNPDAISEMTMIKGAFPSNYGGRLSSILDVRMKDGHDNKIHGTGGIGLLSSRLTLEGPIKREKMSFLISGRRTYIDKVFKAAGLTVPYYFYDINAKLNYKFTDNDRLFYSLYYGDDVLAFDSTNLESQESGTEDADLGLNFGFNLGNLTNTLRWNHIHNSKLFSNISLISTRFKYNILGKITGDNLLISSDVFDLGVKADYDYYMSSENHIKFGISTINHVFKPNLVSTTGEISEFLTSQTSNQLYTNEMAVYAHSDRDLNEKVRLKYGMRLSGATVKGKFYSGIEPRIALRYFMNKNDAIKASYSRMKQYMHRVSSSTVALPTDLWYPVTKNIKPQISDQIAIGYNYLFEDKKIALILEGYYKWMNNLIEYREGANLILNDNFEDEMIQGKGTAYGAEFLVKKDEGKLSGWISYTLSWATRDYDELNRGETFFAKYDRRHMGSVVLNYKLNKRWTVSSVWVYQTGSRFTAQTGQYFMPNATLTGVDIIPVYTDRNEVQLSPSHRLDLNFTLHGKEKKKFKNEWSFGCYNLYNRAQPYRVNIVAAENGVGYKYQQPGLFGFIPSIAYNFNF